jgi:hypothetical protein
MALAPVAGSSAEGVFPVRVWESVLGRGNAAEVGAVEPGVLTGLVALGVGVWVCVGRGGSALGSDVGVTGVGVGVIDALGVGVPVGAIEGAVGNDVGVGVFSHGVSLSVGMGP